MATRRLNPKLLAAFEAAQVEPPDLDVPERVVEAPVPPEQMQTPRTRFDVVSEYLQRSRQPIERPDVAEADVGAARERDAQRDFGAGMLAAGQAFTGNRRAVGQLQETNANESAALAQNAARRKALEDWAQAQERQRLGEAGLLGQALSADEAAKARADAADVQRRRLELDAEKEATRAEDKDLDREAKAKAREAGATAAAKKASDKADAQSLKDTSALRKEFDALPEVKEYKGVFGSFEKVSQAAKDPSPAGDLALIYAFNKILDYGSAVKEAEFQNAQNAGSMMSKAQAAAEQVASGKRLTPAQRADFVAQAKNVAGAGRTLYEKAVKRYQDLASKGGLSPEDVAQDVGNVGAPSSGVERPAPSGKIPMVSMSSGRTIFVSPETAAAGEKSKTLRKP